MKKKGLFILKIKQVQLFHPERRENRSKNMSFVSLMDFRRNVELNNTIVCHNRL